MRACVATGLQRFLTHMPKIRARIGELAERTGLAPGSLRAYEDGLRQPHERSTARLAAVLGDDMLGGQDRFSDAS